MNLKEIREMVKLMNDNELAEIEVEHEGTKIKIRKSIEGGVTYTTAKAPTAVPVEAPVTNVASAPAAPVAATNQQEIKSPMVGTFYRAPSPESPPYVEVGQIVEVGQVVCIIEAMKLMNEIKSEVRGKVVRVNVENAQPVEFGQTMFLIEPQ